MGEDEVEEVVRGLITRNLKGPHPVLYPDFYQGARLSVTVVLSVTLAVVNLIFIEIDG